MNEKAGGSSRLMSPTQSKVHPSLLLLLLWATEDPNQAVGT